MFKEMIYQAKRLTPPEQIAMGTYKGLDYYVLNLGTHPCAYIDVTNTSLHGIEYEEIDVVVHGGLTYSRPSLATVDKSGWFIGWDYAHCSDFTGYEIDYPENICLGGKHWTTGEIVAECLDVINQMVINQMV